jgi:HEXXH motif-containing protein
MKFHRLNTDHITALSAGLGGPSAVRELKAIQISRRLLLLKYIGENWPVDRHFWDDAIATLSRVQEMDPEIFTDLMADPLVGAWLIRTTTQIRHTGSAAEADLGHLSCVAAAAAMRSCVDVELTGYAVNGRLTLPQFGEMRFSGEATGSVLMRISRAAATLVSSTGETASTGGPGWRPLRRLTGGYRGLACAIRVEDGNPYRDGYHAPPSERLTSVEAETWQALFADAWTLIGHYLPERVAELAEGLRAVVPLQDLGDGAARSGTARESIGALGLTKPRSPEDFVITIVHEFQHSKLSAVLDLLELYESNGQERHFAPWRMDARPTAGLIQGVYAFLGVAEAWRGLRADPDLATAAEHQFAEVREQVRVGLEALERSIELTPDGIRFVAGMRAALDQMLAEPISEASLDRARSALAERKRRWKGSPAG